MDGGTIPTHQDTPETVQSTMRGFHRPTVALKPASRLLARASSPRLRMRVVKQNSSALRRISGFRHAAHSNSNQIHFVAVATYHARRFQSQPLSSPLRFRPALHSSRTPQRQPIPESANGQWTRRRCPWRPRLSTGYRSAARRRCHGCRRGREPMASCAAHCRLPVGFLSVSITDVALTRTVPPAPHCRR